MAEYEARVPINVTVIVSVEADNAQAAEEKAHAEIVRKLLTTGLFDELDDDVLGPTQVKESQG